MISLTKNEIKIILAAIQYEKETLNPDEYSSEDISTIKSIENEIKMQPPFLSSEQLGLIVDYLDFIVENNGRIDQEVLNLQHKIKGYLQTR